MANRLREELEQYLQEWLKTTESFRGAQHGAYGIIKCQIKQIFENCGAEEELEDINDRMYQLERQYEKIIDRVEEYAGEIRDILQELRGYVVDPEESVESTNYPEVQIIPPPVYLEAQFVPPPEPVPQPVPMYVPPPAPFPIEENQYELPPFPLDANGFEPEMDRILNEMMLITQRMDAGQRIGCFICASLDHETYQHQ